MDKNTRTTVILTEKLRLDLKIMCAMTKKSMADFIRIAIREKINALKNEAQGKK